MPSHTFTRVGYWQESIDANVASGAVARRDGVVGEELHAMDYRTYAYLQTAQDAKARAMIDALPEVAGRFNPNGPAVRRAELRRVSSRWRRFRRATRSNAARGPRRRRSSRTRAAIRTPRR